MLFSVTDANLKTVANGGSVGKADGTDLLFTASDGVTKLNHELEFYNPATGQVSAWVRCPRYPPARTRSCMCITATQRRPISRTRPRLGQQLQSGVASGQWNHAQRRRLDQ